ncbi:MAG: hypothetical protein AAFZ07_20350 [Actinomycetota bacterium]
MTADDRVQGALFDATAEPLQASVVWVTPNRNPHSQLLHARLIPEGPVLCGTRISRRWGTSETWASRLSGVTCLKCRRRLERLAGFLEDVDTPWRRFDDGTHLLVAADWFEERDMSDVAAALRRDPHERSFWRELRAAILLTEPGDRR